jgi:hypothetical protein
MGFAAPVGARGSGNGFLAVLVHDDPATIDVSGATQPQGGLTV